MGAEINSWTTARILDALRIFDADEIPNDFLEIRTAEYRIIRYPEWLLSPTLPAAQVVSSNTSRPLENVFGEISSIVRDWRLDELHWWVTNKTHPFDTEIFLRERGGVLSDSVQVLAREIDDSFSKVASLDSEVIKLVRDEQSLRAAIHVETEGWDRATPKETEIEFRLSQIVRDLKSSSEFQVVAFHDGNPVATGCCMIKSEVARLYGGVTLQRYRSRGFYQAVLDARLRLAYEFGATVAVTRGRPLTSGPILIKNGFRVQASENCYRIKIN